MFSFWCYLHTCVKRHQSYSYGKCILFYRTYALVVLHPQVPLLGTESRVRSTMVVLIMNTCKHFLLVIRPWYPVNILVRTLFRLPLGIYLSINFLISQPLSGVCLLCPAFYPGSGTPKPGQEQVRLVSSLEV